MQARRIGRGLAPLLAAVVVLLRSATSWSRKRLDAIEAVRRPIAADIVAKIAERAAAVEQAHEELAAKRAPRCTKQKRLGCPYHSNQHPRTTAGRAVAVPGVADDEPLALGA